MKRSEPTPPRARRFTAVALACLIAVLVLAGLPLAASGPGSLYVAWNRLAASAPASTLAAVWGGMVSRAPDAVAARLAEREVRAAWRRAREAGAYRFTADVRQTVVPASTIYNAGRGSEEQRLYLQGDADMRAGTLGLTLWTGGGSVLGSQGFAAAVG